MEDMSTILVTGATGTLGTPTTAKLREAGHDVRALSRRTGSGLTTGDLLTGEGIHGAFAGVDVVVHLATGAEDVDQAKAAIGAARDADVKHFVLISIVGIDDIPLGYYKGKVTIEKYLLESGLPYTILRATQFHQFVEGIFTAQKFSPVIIVPRFSFQPISTEEVADRLTELVAARPAGRVADIGGPEQRTARGLAQSWQHSREGLRPVWAISLPGKTVSGFAAGHNLVPGTPFGVMTFDQYLDGKDRSTRPATPR